MINLNGKDISFTITDDCQAMYIGNDCVLQAYELDWEEILKELGIKFFKIYVNRDWFINEQGGKFPMYYAEVVGELELEFPLGH